MDGNGRWAAQRHLPRVEGHRAGIDSVRDAVETSARLGIKVLTLYAFSVENWKRPATEVSTLMVLLKHYLRSELNTLLRNNIRFRVIGRMEDLAPDIQRELRDAEARTAAQHRHAVQHRAELRRPGRDRRGGAPGACADGMPPDELDEARFAVLPLHRRPARSRSADPHQRRDARQQLPALADRLRRDLGDRHAVAGLPRSGTCSRPSSPTRSAIAATAASTSRRSPDGDVSSATSFRLAALQLPARSGIRL